LLHVRVIAAVAIVVAAAKAANALNVVSVRKETDHKVETAGMPAPVNKLGIGHRVHKVIVRYVHRVSVVGVRQDRAASNALHVNHARRVNAQRVHRVNVLHAHRLSSLLHRLRRNRCLRRLRLK